MMEESVTTLAGPKGKHNPDRAAVRHGHEHGSVTLGGRCVGVQRPRMRAADGSGELPVAAYQLFAGRLALERMLGGLSTRRYPVGLEPVGTQAEQTATGTSKSAVSRRFVAMTHTALAELLSADLSELDLVCLLIDGVHFGEHTCVVALGIDIDGTKHPLALVEGSTENTTLARDLLTGLRERGLDTTRPILCVIDGAKALRRAILDVFDHPVIARCQQHKIRNVRDKLPERLQGPVEHRMRTAYHAASALDPKPSCSPWPASSTRPTPAPPPAYARALPRPSPCCGWASRRPWPARCTPRMKVSRPCRRCLLVVAPLGSGLGVVDPGAKSRTVGLEVLPRSLAPLRA
jgi:hypothetical protein